MLSFKDKAGRQWSLALTVGTVKRVESMTGVNLGACDQRMFEALATDWCKLVDVVCAVVRPQLEEGGMSDEDFAEALGGDELQSAIDALLAALVDFFPPKKRPVLQKAIDKMNAMQDQILARATARLENLTLPSEAADSGASSGTVPASSDATPQAGIWPGYLPPPTPASPTNGQ